jgi:pimeloyl-ACP methyl ester carboxylesterase
MSEYIDVDGIRTWYDELGKGEPLVLMHPGGAGVDARAWSPNLPALAEQFSIFTPERRAHGRTPDMGGPITFELMAKDTIAFLDKVVREPGHLIDCSDRAIVTLLVAMHRPDLIRKLVLVAGMFHRNGWAPGVADPDNTPPESLAQSYGELSPDGPEHYPIDVAKLAKLGRVETGTNTELATRVNEWSATSRAASGQSPANARTVPRRPSSLPPRSRPESSHSGWRSAPTARASTPPPRSPQAYFSSAAALVLAR